MERLQINNQKLDRLPVEIIQCIAAFCACISVFELSKTNKVMYEACNDRQIFKVIIENRNGYDGPVWDSIPLTAEFSRDAWARWALADLKGRQWLPDQGLKTPIQQQRFLSWAPLLMTRSHVLANSVSARQLCRKYDSAGRLNPDGTNVYALALCLAIRLLSTDLPGNPSAAPAPDMEWFEHMNEHLGYNERCKLAYVLGCPLYALSHADNDGPSNPELEDLNDFKLKYRSRAVTAVAIMAERLRNALNSGPFTSATGQQWSPHALILPSVKDLVFQQLDILPTPFDRTTAAELPTLHLPAMTSPGYLEDGEWTGVYTISFGLEGKAVFDPPMCGVKFSTSLESDGNGNQTEDLHLKAEGWDGVAPFDLDGILSRHDGKVTMTKKYAPAAGGHSWEWSLLMTPFGLAGSWGDRDLGGWVWLWKTVKRKEQS